MASKRVSAGRAAAAGWAAADGLGGSSMGTGVRRRNWRRSMRHSLRCQARRRAWRREDGMRTTTEFLWLTLAGAMAVPMAMALAAVGDQGAPADDAATIRAARADSNAAHRSARHRRYRPPLVAGRRHRDLDRRLRPGPRRERRPHGRSSSRAGPTPSTCERPRRSTSSAAWNVAAERGEWTGRWTEPDGVVEIAGTYQAQWRKVGGTWRIQAELFVPTRCHGSSTAPPIRRRAAARPASPRPALPAPRRRVRVAGTPSGPVHACGASVGGSAGPPGGTTCTARRDVAEHPTRTSAPPCRLPSHASAACSGRPRAGRPRRHANCVTCSRVRYMSGVSPSGNGRIEF